MEVVAICDHLGFFVLRELKQKVGGQAFPVAFDLFSNHSPAKPGGFQFVSRSKRQNGAAYAAETLGDLLERVGTRLRGVGLIAFDLLHMVASALHDRDPPRPGHAVGRNAIQDGITGDVA